MKRDIPEKGNAILILVLVVIIAVIALWIFTKAQVLPTAIQSTNDLNVVAKDLDNTDLNQIDTTQSQITSDSANF